MLKRFFAGRIWGLTLACLAVLALIFLAIGLADIRFLPGRPLARAESQSIQISVEKIAAQIANIPFWKQIVFWALIFVLVLAIASFFSPELRRRIILYFLRLAFFCLALFFILGNFRTLFSRLNLSGVLSAGAGAQSGPFSIPAVFVPPRVGSATLYLVSLIVVLLLGGAAFLSVRYWQRRRYQAGSLISLDEFAGIARSSLSEISAGMDWQDAILQAYARMSLVVAARRGLHRPIHLTAGEFIARLEAAGLPAEAVRRLTRLFEAARYGHISPQSNEALEAIACLRTILTACGVSE